MSRKFVWVSVGLIAVVWSFFFFWKLISKKDDVVTKLESRVVEDTFCKQLPLTEVRIKNKVVKLNAVRTGEKVTARYVLYNTGNNPLFIEYVNPDCSCTGYEVSDSITFPGDSLQIMLKFDTTGKAGINFMSAQSWPSLRMFPELLPD